MMKAIRNVKQENFAMWWSQQSPVRRLNIMKSAITIAVFSMIVGALKAWGDKDDEKRFAWLQRDLFMLVAASDFLESPIPLFNVVNNLSSITGASDLLNIGPMRDVKALERYLESKGEDVSGE